MMKSKLLLFGFCTISFYTVKADGLNNKIEKADNVKVIFLKTQKHLSFTVHQKLQVQFFKKLIINAKNQTDLKCDTNAEIVYYQGKKQIFTAYYSFGINNQNHKRPLAVSFHSGKTDIISRVNYNVGMMINEKYYQLTKTH